MAQVTGSATSLTASWSAPDLNGGPALTGYEVRYRAGSTGTWTSPTSHSGTTTTIMNLMPDTSYQVQVRALNGETPSDWSDASAAVKTNDLPKLSVADVSAEEGNSLTFTVTLTPASTATVTVRAATSIASDDTAESGDFTAVPSTTLTFAAGETSKTVPVSTDEDTTDEDNETFTLTLSNATNAEISDATATGTIVNDDTPPVLSVADATATEGSPVRFTVRLSAASGRTVTVNVATSIVSSDTAVAGDFTAVSSRTLTFAPGDQSKTVSVTTTNDALDEADEETFTLTLSGASNATLSATGTTATGTTATGTITDNDNPPVLSVQNVTAIEGSAVTFTVSLSAESGRTVTVNVATSIVSSDTAVAGDFTAVSSRRLTFAPGDRSKTVSVSTTDDALDEDDETFTVTLSAESNATLSATGTTATGTITDNDPKPRITIGKTSANEDDEVVVPLTLNTASGKEVSALWYVNTGGTFTAEDEDLVGDLSLSPTRKVVFPPGSTSVQIRITLVDDTTDEGDETFQVQLGSATNASFAIASNTVTIKDNDPAPTVTLVLTPSSIAEERGSTTVTATLSNPSSEATTVTVSAAAVSPAEAGDFALGSNRTLAIAAGSTSSTGTVTVTAVGNNVDAPDREVTVSATATNTQGVDGNPDDVTLTIEDDEDSPAVTLLLSASSISENGGTTVATASLSGPSSEATTVTLTPAPGDWTADGGGRLTIPAGATQSDGSVTLTAVNDDTDAPEKMLTVTATATNSQVVEQPAGKVLAITDDEEAPTATLTVSALTIGENGGEATVSVKLDHPSSEATTVTVTAAGADPKAAEFTLTGAVLTVTAGETAGSSRATLTATDNETDAPNQTVAVMARAENTQGIADNNLDDVTLTIEDDEVMPTVTLSLSAPTIGEDGGETEVTAALSHPSSEATTVAVRAEAVSPAEAGDFTLSGSVLTIAEEATDSTGTVTVTAVDNDVDAPDKRVTVSAEADNKQGFAGHPADVTLTISNDDERGLAFSPPARTLSESEVAQNAYTVALNSEPTATVTLRVTSPGVTALGVSDASLSPILASWTLTFTPDDWDDPQALSLVAGADADSAPDTVQLGHAAMGGDYQDLNENYTVTITDTDAPTRNIVLSVDRVEVPEGGGAQTLEVTARLDAAPLTAAATVAVTVGAGTATSTDFTALPATFNLTIAAGGFSASQTVTVTLTPVADALVEGPETVAVTGTTTTTTTQEGTTTVLGVTGTEVTIADDDARGVTVAADDPLEVEEAGSATYTVVLNSEPTGEVTVTPTVTGNTDVTVTPAVLIFTASTWDTAQRVTVSAADDDDTADDEATVTHAVAGADYGENRVTADSVTVSVEDDDSQGISVSTGALTVPEGAGAAEVTVTAVLEAALETATAIAVAVSGGTAEAGADFAPVAGFTVTVPAGATQGSATFELVPVDDAVDEGAGETVTVAGTAPGLAVEPATLTIADDDDTPVTLAVSPAEVREDGGSARVRVSATLGAAAPEPVALTLRLADGTAAAGADFVPLGPVTLTIAAGSTSGAVTVTGSAAGFTVAPATLTLLDDDEAPAADARSPSTVLGLSVAVVAGPAVVSVEDAWVQEGAGATLDFAVRLSRARDAETRVEWATVDGTARAGADYEAAAGTVVFVPGETLATVVVAVRDDAHDEGEETLEVVLSNPVGARLGDARATGTISNTGHIPRAWLARFGRTAAEQVLGAVQGRFAAARAPGTEVRLVGQPVGAADAQAREAQARRAARAHRGEAGWDGVQGLESREVTGRDFLTGSSFALTTGTEAGGFASVWGRGAVSRFDAREGERTLDGEVSGALLGVDWRVGRGTAGLMLSLSRGAGEYAKGDDCTQESCAGEVSSTLTGLYPYGRYAVSERVTVWGVAGYGTGMLRLEPQGEAPMEADTDLALGALGVRGVLVQAPGGDGIELAVVSDGLLVRTSSEAVPGLAAAAGDVMRLRLGVEGTWRGLEAGGARLVPSLELGVRHDGGDAETGFGADIGAGLAWSDATRGIEARLGGRALLAHEDSGLRERGFSASLAFDPTPGSDRGVRLTLAQTMGAQATGGADALLARTTMAGLAANDEGEAPGRRRLEATLGYGFPVFAGRFTGTPEVGVALSQAERSYRLGWRLGLAGDGRVSLGLKLEGTRREPAADGAPEHAVALRLNARW